MIKFYCNCNVLYCIILYCDFST